MSLTDLPHQVWDVLNQYVKIHHRARLFLTGCAKLQRDIIHSRRSEDAAHRNDYWTVWTQPSSPLVRDILIPTAVDVRITEDDLLTSSVIGDERRTFPRMRSLVCHMIRNGGYVTAGVDLRRQFYKLERVKLRGVRKCTFFLPTSLTHLSAGPAETVKNLTELVNLTTLSVTFTCAELARFKSELAWPPHLISLKVSLVFETHQERTSVDETLAALPPTLLHLTVADMRFNLGQFDVVPPAACDKLVSFEVRGHCEFKVAGARFPPSLTKLVVLELSVASASDPVFEALRCSNISHIAAPFLRNVTSDTCDYILYGLEPIIERANIEGLEALVSSLCKWETTACAMSGSLEAACRRALSKFGMSDRHFDLLRFVYTRSWSVPAITEMCDPAQVRRCLDSSKEMRRHLTSRRHLHLGTSVSTDWYLKFGFTVPIDNETVARYGYMFGREIRGPVLFECCVVDDEKVAEVSWSELFGRHVFPDVMELVLHDREHGSAILGALAAHRSHFPRLEIVTFWQRRTSVPELDVAVLAAMRFYQRPHKVSSFIYRVSPPPTA